MSTTDIEDESAQILEEIEAEKGNLNEDEQNFLDAWISKLKGLDEDDVPIRNEYLAHLRNQLIREDKHLSLPYLNMPPESNLPHLQDLLDQLRQADAEAGAGGPSDQNYRRYLCSAPERKPPCRRRTTFAKPPYRMKKSDQNDFENFEEMARCIARSKGMTLAEFVADISLHTSDNGRELQEAMKVEVASARDYVERIMIQRIKDVDDRLEDEQNNDRCKFQRDIDKWHSELSNCRKIIKEMVPDFDLEAYRKDPNYLKKLFIVDSSNPPAEDSFKEWKERNCHRLMWFVDQMSKLTGENNQVLGEITAIQMKTLELEKKEADKQQRHANYMKTEGGKYQRLKQKSDKLAREIADLVLKLED